tara:strand:+ start:5494 stop:6612 length:1119 start_codon:yes stop_codon:yes gene_type:complete
MKILYIGHYREGTGWGNAAIEYILAMHSAGLDVVCRAIKLNDVDPEVPALIDELEAKSIKGCDVCIQHVLPHMIDYNGKFDKNIALYATETSNFKKTTWAEKINTMDEAWVINQEMVEVSRASDVSIPIKVVPHACSMSKYERSYPRLELPTEDKFTFYFIGEVIRRKNLVALLKAFHLVFDSSEPVSLVIKTNKSGMSPEECQGHVLEMCDTVKNNLKLHSKIEDYSREIIITQRLTEEQMCSLHQHCDCFVMPSFGEAWCIPAFDAMGFGNTPICSNSGGMSDFVGKSGFLVDGAWEPVFGMTETFSDLCTGYEDWFNINVRELGNTMRTVYENRHKSSLKEMSNKGFDMAEEYSHENIGNLIKELLNAS